MIATDKAIKLHRVMYERRLRNIEWLHGRTAEQVLQEIRYIRSKKPQIKQETPDNNTVIHEKEAMNKECDQIDLEKSQNI